MRGTMMNFPLTLPTILERSGKIFPRVEIVSRKPDNSIVRTCYGDFYRRARRLGAALSKLGLEPGDRVASMMWNHASHLEAFFGVPCAGDRKSTRLNSSHTVISYAVFCLKKKKNTK